MSNITDAKYFNFLGDKTTAPKFTKIGRDLHPGLPFCQISSPCVNARRKYLLKIVDKQTKKH